jgi:hypothetical protein
VRAAALSVGIFMMTGVASAIPVFLAPAHHLSSLDSDSLADSEVPTGCQIGQLSEIEEGISDPVAHHNTTHHNTISGVAASAVTKVRAVPGAAWKVDRQYAGVSVPEPGTYTWAITGLGRQPVVPRRLGPIPFA